MTSKEEKRFLTLLALAKMYWPHVSFYKQQREAIASVIENNETVLVSGNELGKDFTAGFICISFFLWPQLYFAEEYVVQIEEMFRRQSTLRPNVSPLHVHTRRIVTTSVKEKHLGVLWGEMGRYLATSTTPLIETKDSTGPLIINSFELRFKEEQHVKKPYNYLIGNVSEQGEGLAGHHAAYTLGVIDEASGVHQDAYTFMQGWVKKFLIFGNAHPCVNFFYQAVKGGNLAKPH